MCMCCCNPSPFPNVSLMYINPNSRGQCVLGEVKLLSSQSIAFNLHSSACGPHSGPETCVLLFQRRAVYLELITGTHSDLSGLPIPVHLSTCFPSACVQCICVHLYLCGRLFLFSVPLLWVAIFVMQKSETISYRPTDQPQYHVATDHPAGSVVRIYCQTAYSCHFSVGLNRLPVGLM